jgi:hypothetical protein
MTKIRLNFSPELAFCTFFKMNLIETNKDRKITQVTTFNKMKNKQYQTVRIVS